MRIACEVETQKQEKNKVSASHPFPPLLEGRARPSPQEIGAARPLERLRPKLIYKTKMTARHAPREGAGPRRLVARPRAPRVRPRQMRATSEPRRSTNEPRAAEAAAFRPPLPRGSGRAPRGAPRARSGEAWGERERERALVARVARRDARGRPASTPRPRPEPASAASGRPPRPLEDHGNKNDAARPVAARFLRREPLDARRRPVGPGQSRPRSPPNPASKVQPRLSRRRAVSNVFAPAQAST